MRPACLLPLALALCTAGQSPPPSGPTVTLKQGLLEGVHSASLGGRPFAAFWGVPYAKPPTGKHRFKEAVPAGPWMGTYRAKEPATDCIQYDHFTYKSQYPIHGSEDCLYLNVFSPQLPSGTATAEKLLDVIVYIHGGAFTYGAGRYYGPNHLMDKDVVFVTINYRLGPMGFLSTEDDLIPGNNGMKDQVLALKWVKDNIAAFGGNPLSVTIAGMSAGGASVHYHMLSPMSRGLFSKAISMSGSALCPWTQVEDSLGKAHLLAMDLGCPTNASMVDCLRHRPAEDIVKVTRMLMPWLYNPYSPFGVVVENPGSKAFLDRHPVEIIASGMHNDVPWLVSWTSHEGLYPGAEILCDAAAYEEVKSRWLDIAEHLLDFSFTIDPTKAEQVKKEIWNKYMSPEGEAQKDGFIQMLSDRLFIADIVEAAQNQSTLSRSPVYVYKFSYRGHASLSDEFCPQKPNFGVSHGDDLGYITSDFIVDPQNNENDKKMIQAMIDLWVSFASTGTPIFGSVKWPSLQETSPNFSFLEIKSPGSGDLVTGTGADIGSPDFWKSLGLKENERREVPAAAEQPKPKVEL